jgi:uncharacterized protein (TIGR02466 family)
MPARGRLPARHGLRLNALMIETLFVTKLYRTRMAKALARNRALGAAMRAIARDDKAGQRWSKEHGYPGYTSYASLNDLAWRNPDFAALEHAIGPHVAGFARALDYDLAGRKLELDSLWINILKAGGVHTGHIHPHSAVSGTYYVELPAGSGGLKLEDPRAGLMMAAPPRKQRAAVENRTFHYVHPRAGELLLWESWLRHETERHAGKGERLSVSFNYRWT